MSSYFNKISSVVSSAASSAAKQSASILSSISTVAANTSSSSSTHGSASVAIPPKTELNNLFTEFCNIVDQLASLPNAESIDADIKLNQSSARPILKRMIYLLQQESDYWIDHQKFHVQQVQSSKKHIEEIEIPCLEHLLQANIIQGIVNRALTDTPRGLMPLSLTAISHLLRTVEYPLLPHQSVYKSVAKLISFASRYELIISEIVSKEDERYVSYRRRIEIGLTSLLRTIWRKIVENPPVLEFFILTDKRKSITSSTATSTTVRTQIDILSGLFPMILEPKVSYFVQETLLTAINVGDVRIISYLADNTNFPEMMVKLICDHFRESVTLIQSSLQQDPVQQHANKTPGTGSTTVSSQQKLLNLFFGSDKSHLSVFLASANSANNPFGSSGPGSNFPAATPSGKKLPPNSFQSPRPTPLGVASQTVPNTIAALGPGEMNSLEKFIKSILFMKAIYSNLRQQHLAMENHIISLSKIISAATSTITEESGNPEEEGETASVTKKIDANEEELHEKRFFLQKLESLCNKIAFFYYYEFLSDILLPSLESTTNELLTIIHYYLLRILLLSLHDQDHGSRGAGSDVYDNSFAILGNPQKIKKNKRRKSSLIFKKENQQQIGGVAAVNKLVAEEEKINPRRDRSQSEGTSSYDLLQELFPNEALLSLTLKSLFITHHHNHDKSKGWEASLGKKADYQFHSNWFLLLDRSTSLSKVLSLLSIQCVQTIFEVAPPIFLMELQSIQPIRMNQTEYQQLVLFMKQQQASGASETSKDAVNKKSTSNNLWSLRMLEDYQSSFQVELKKILESFPVKEEQGSDDGFVTGGLSSKLIEHSIQQILARLYHHGDATYFAQYSQGHLTSATTTSFAHWWETLLHHTVAAPAASPLTPSGTSSSSEVYYYAYNDYIIDRFLRRLQSYFTMTIDEQILFSQVLYDQYLPIALLIVIQSNDLLCKQQIALLAQFSKKMQYLLDEMEKKYLKQINDLDQKLVYFRQYLFEEAKDFIPNSNNDNITTNHDVKQTTTSNSQSIPPSTPSKTNNNVNNFTTPQKNNNNNPKPSNQTSVFNTPLKSPASAPITPSNTSTAPSSLFKKSFSFLGAATSNNHSNPSSSHGNGSREGSVHAGSTVTTTDTTTSTMNATISTSEEDDKVNPVKASASSYNRVVVRKMIEKESTQHQSILTGYIILQEMFYELQSIFYAIDYLKTLYTSDLLPHTLSTTTPQSSFTADNHQVEEEEAVLTYDEYIANLKSEHDIQMAMVGTVGEQSQQWVELAVNEYEEDEADLMELTKFAQTVTSSMNRNDVMKLEVELEDLYQVFASIEQMISA